MNHQAKRLFGHTLSWDLLIVLIIVVALVWPIGFAGAEPAKPGGSGHRIAATPAEPGRAAATPSTGIRRPTPRVQIKKRPAETETGESATVNAPEKKRPAAAIIIQPHTGGE